MDVKERSSLISQFICKEIKSVSWSSPGSPLSKPYGSPALSPGSKLILEVLPLTTQSSTPSLVVKAAVAPGTPVIWWARGLPSPSAHHSSWYIVPPPSFSYFEYWYFSFAVRVSVGVHRRVNLAFVDSSPKKGLVPFP